MRIVQEHVTHPDRALRVMRLVLDTFRTPRHRHAALELTWVEQGAGQRFVGDSAQSFESGDLVLLGADLPHAWVSGHGPRAGSSVATVLQFPLRLLQQPALPELLACRPLAEQARRGLRITGPCHARVTELLRGLPDAAPLVQLAGWLQVLQALQAHPQDLQPLASSAAPAAGPAGASGRIHRVTDWVQQHLAQDLRPQDAARLAHVSAASFSRFFSRETGKTWSVYVNDLRCAQAAVLLRQSAQPVALVAQECGYRTLSHFNRAFRQRHGVTPSAYRRA